MIDERKKRTRNSYNGRFKNDEKMPLFSTDEFNAAFRYLDLKLDIDRAITQRDNMVVVNQQLLSMTEAQIKLASLKEELDRAVREETLKVKPDATEELIAKRTRDIIGAMNDTAYISETYRSGR